MQLQALLGSAAPSQEGTVIGYADCQRSQPQTARIHVELAGRGGGGWGKGAGRGAAGPERGERVGGAGAQASFAQNAWLCRAGELTSYADGRKSQPQAAPNSKSFVKLGCTDPGKAGQGGLARERCEIATAGNSAPLREICGHWFLRFKGDFAGFNMLCWPLRRPNKFHL